MKSFLFSLFLVLFCLPHAEAATHLQYRVRLLVNPGADGQVYIGGRVVEAPFVNAKSGIGTRPGEVRLVNLTDLDFPELARGAKFTVSFMILHAPVVEGQMADDTVSINASFYRKGQKYGTDIISAQIESPQYTAISKFYGYGSQAQYPLATGRILKATVAVIIDELKIIEE